MRTLDPTGWRALARSALIVGACVLGADALVRARFPDDDWRYWRMPVGERVDLLRARPVPDVLFLGDSSAAFNLVPEDFDRGAGVRSFNLGTRGNAARSFDATMIDVVLPELDELPDWFIVSFAPRAYSDDPAVEVWERSVLASNVARAARADVPWSDRIGLARLRFLLFLPLDPIHAADPELERHAGWTPYGAGSEGRVRARTKAPPPPFPELAAPPSPRHRARIDPERVAVLETLADLAPVGLIVVAMPARGHLTGPLRRALAALDHPKLRVWDTLDATDWAAEDGVHMAPETARRYSAMLGDRFRREIVHASAGAR